MTWRREDSGYAVAVVAVAVLVGFLVAGNFGLVPSPIAPAEIDGGPAPDVAQLQVAADDDAPGGADPVVPAVAPAPAAPGPAPAPAPAPAPVQTPTPAPLDPEQTLGEVTDTVGNVVGVVERVPDTVGGVVEDLPDVVDALVGALGALLGR